MQILPASTKRLLRIGFAQARFIHNIHSHCQCEAQNRGLEGCTLAKPLSGGDTSLSFSDPCFRSLSG